MGKGRTERFSDAVLAIVITVMVLEMRTPKGAEVSALRPALPAFLSYVLSFVYWNTCFTPPNASRGRSVGEPASAL